MSPIDGPEATHEVFNQSQPLQDYNLVDSDLCLRQTLAAFQGEAADPRLVTHGQRCGSAEVIQWGYDANEQRPRLESHDRFGHRLDQVFFHPAYHQLMDLALTSRVHSLPWQTPGSHRLRAALNYLQNQVEAGHACPLTMTFAAVPTLKKTPAIAERWLPKLLCNQYQPDNIPFYQKHAVTLGMGMTEKQGGSDVRANTTRATPLGSAGPGELYSLTGHKWFLSAPMCDAFLMLAQAAGGLSCFLVPRWREDGVKNALLLQRLKNKMGNVANASSEVELRGAHGWLVGEEGRGVPAILEMVSLTRFDCMIGSSAGQRQAVAQAVFHARQRRAFGKALIDQPLMRNVLADLQLEVEGSLAMTLRMAAALDQPDDPHEQNLLRLGTAVGKYWICKRTPGHAYEAMECLGGNGVIENCIMPRLYREAPINAIWEGSGNIQALDILRVMQKSPEAMQAWHAEIDHCRGYHPGLDQMADSLTALLAQPQTLEFQARTLANTLALCFQGAMLLRHGDPVVAKAFCDSRLSASAPLYGGLPASVDVDTILQRVLPTDIGCG